MRGGSRVMLCPSCSAENKEGRKFCKQCGAPLPAACPHCGYTGNEPGDKFCGNCGKSLEAVAVEVPPPPPRVEAPLLPRVAPPRPVAEPAYLERLRSERMAGLKQTLSNAQVERLVQGAAQHIGERRNVTVMMADISGFTATSEVMDAEEITGIVNDCFDLLVPVIYRYEGHIDKFMGDAIMALFGAPIAREDAPERAVRAALEMLEKFEIVNRKHAASLPVPLQMHIGINSGPVVWGGVGAQDLAMQYTVMGDTVNLASRLESHAEPGEVLVSRETFLRTQGSFDYEELPPIRVKGKREPVPVYRALALKRRASRLELARQRGVAEMVGREVELAQLEEIAARASKGQLEVVGVTGEAGVGKSRLVYEVVTHMQAEGALLVEGRCVSFGAGISYLPVADLIRNYFRLEEGESEAVLRPRLARRVRELDPDLAESLPYFGYVLGFPLDIVALSSRSAAERRQGIFEAVAALLRVLARQQPVIVVLDDLHWMDESSLALFANLMEELAEERILVVHMFRPGFSPPWANRSYYTELSLKRLDEAHSKHLTDGLLAVYHLPPAAEKIVLAKAEGNPLCMEEIVRALSESVAAHPEEKAELSLEQVPNTLQDIIMARIDRLEPEAKTLLRVASVVGRSFSAGLVSRVLENPQAQIEAVLDKLSGLQLVNRSAVGESSYEFEHSLTQEVTYQSLLHRDKRDYHLSVARNLEDMLGDRAEAECRVLAYHYYLGKGGERAAKYLVLAAQHENEQAAHRSSLTFCDQGLEVVEETPEYPGGGQDRMRLLVLRGTDLSIMGRAPEGMATFAQLFSLARKADDWNHLAAAAYGVARTLMQEMADWERAKQYFRVCLFHLEGHELTTRKQKERRVNAMIGTGTSSFLLGDLSEAKIWWERAREADEALGESTPARMALYNNLAELYKQQGQYKVAMDYYERCLSMYQEGRRDPRGHAYVLTGIAMLQKAIGDFRQAAERMEQGLAMAREMDEKSLISGACADLAHFYTRLGEYDRALTLSQEARAVAESLGNVERVAQGRLAQAELLSELGNQEAALTSARDALEMARSIGSDDLQGIAHRILGDIQSHHQDGQMWHEALESYTAALRILRRSPNHSEQSAAAAGSARIHMSRGHMDRAVETVQPFLEAMRAEGLRQPLAEGLVVLGDVEQSKGNLEAAARLFREALELAESCGCQRSVWELHSRLALNAQQRGDVAAAQEHARAAVSAVRAVRGSITSPELAEAFDRAPHIQQVLETCLPLAEAQPAPS